MDNDCKVRDFVQTLIGIPTGLEVSFDAQERENPGVD